MKTENKPTSRPSRGRALRSLGFLARSPVRPFSLSDVRGGASLVSGLYELLKRRWGARDGVRLSDGRIDVVATAAAYGVTPLAVEIFLARQQNAAYWRTLAGIGLSLCLLGAWLYVALFWNWNRQLLVTALEFLPFWTALAMFVLEAARENWIYRERRAGSVRAFITSADTLWPKRSTS